METGFDSQPEVTRVSPCYILMRYITLTPSRTPLKPINDAQTEGSLRTWCSGNIPSFQVGVTGSIPVVRFLLEVN